MMRRLAVPVILLLIMLVSHHYQADAATNGDNAPDAASAVEEEKMMPSLRSESVTLRGSSSSVDIEDDLALDDVDASYTLNDMHDDKRFREDLQKINSQMSTFFGRVKKTDFTDWLRECIEPFRRAGFLDHPAPYTHRYSTYYMKDQPSGLCPLHLYLSFQGGMWNDRIQAVLNKTDLQSANFEDIKDELPPLALPDYMSFPQTAKDVVKIVKLANKYEKKISIKNSGHTYTQGSNSANSININMREFPKYSFKELYECNEETASEPLTGPPCKLALARGKTAVARIGGGQGNDDMFRSVIDWNYKQPREKRYFALGGDDGMVGGGGGFFQGGGLGRGEERLYGNGADQVLEIEMILPDGKHVKFGPTEWEHKEGYIYPQTIKVGGKCNNNIHHDESKWEWVECPDSKPFPDVEFQDLWFAVRGGGGGVWGVVLSTYQQLHDLVPQFMLEVDNEVIKDIAGRYCTSFSGSDKSEMCLNFLVKFPPMVHNMYLDFVIDLIWNVEDNDIGIDEDLGKRCGFTWFKPFNNPFSLQDPPLIVCHGYDIQEKFQQAWKTSIAKSKNWLDEYRNEEVECLLGSLIYMEGGYYDKWRRVKMSAMTNSDNPPDWFYSPIGNYLDGSGLEGTYIAPNFEGIMFPPEFFQPKTVQVYDFLKRINGGHTLPYASASDGMEPTSKLYRSGGIETKVNSDSDLPSIYNLIGYNSTSDDFPGIFEYNHFHATNPGLLKSDPTKVCPSYYSNEEKKVHCMSMQEAVWGTKTFNRLTAIKNAIDPKNLFDVHFGIGNNERSNAEEDYHVTEKVAPGPGRIFSDMSTPKITNPSVCVSQFKDPLNPFEDKDIFDEETH